MKKFFMQAISFLFVTATIISCSNKASKEAKYIPKEASTVIVADAASIAGKLESGNISLDSLLKEIVHNDSSYNKIKPKFEELKNCGINWKDKFYIFSDQQVLSGKGTLSFFSFLINITDEEKFTAYLKKVDGLKNKEIKKDKNCSYIELEEKGIISWNKSTAIVTIAMYAESAKNPFDLGGKNEPIKVQNKEEFNKVDELKKEVFRYYDLKEKESIASVKIFTDMFSEKADGFIYRNTNGLVNYLANMPFQIPKLEELIQNNYSVSTFNFMDGKIVGSSKTFPNAAVSALLQKYSGPTVNVSMIDHFPSQNIDGFFLASFNPEFFNGLLKELEVENLVNGFLEKQGFTAADIYKCLKGDIAVGVSDVNVSFGSDKKPFGKLIITAPVADKNSLNKIFDKVAESGFLVKTSQGYAANALIKSIGLFIKIDDKNITIASDSLTYQQYFANAQKANIPADVLSQIKGKSTAAYVDLQQIFNMFENEKSSDETRDAVDHAKATFKDVIATSDNFNGKSIDGNYEVRMKDAKQNSLVTILKLIPNISGPLKKTETVEDIKSLSFLKLIYLPIVR